MIQVWGFSTCFCPTDPCSVLLEHCSSFCHCFLSRAAFLLHATSCFPAQTHVMYKSAWNSLFLLGVFLAFTVRRRKSAPNQHSCCCCSAQTSWLLMRVKTPESIIIVRFMRTGHTPYTLTGHTQHPPGGRKANSLPIKIQCVN